MARGERQQTALFSRPRREKQRPTLPAIYQMAVDASFARLDQLDDERDLEHPLLIQRFAPFQTEAQHRYHSALDDSLSSEVPSVRDLARLDFLAATAWGEGDKELRPILDQALLALGRSGTELLAERGLISDKTASHLRHSLDDDDPSRSARQLASWTANVACAAKMRDHIAAAGPQFASVTKAIDEVISDFDKNSNRDHLVLPVIAHQVSMESGAIAEALTGSARAEQQRLDQSGAGDIAAQAVSDYLGPSPQGDQPPVIVVPQDVMRRLIPDPDLIVDGGFSHTTRAIFLSQEGVEAACQEASQGSPDYTLVHEMVHARRGLLSTHWRAGRRSRQSAAYQVLNEGVAEELTDEICQRPHPTTPSYHAYEALVEALEQASGQGDGLTRQLADSSDNYATALAKAFGGSGSYREQRQINRLLSKYQDAVGYDQLADPRPLAQQTAQQLCDQLLG